MCAASSEGRAHDDEGGAGVTPLGDSKRGDAVRDRLDAGDGGAARREGSQDDEQRRPGEPAAPGVPDGHETGVVQRLHGEVAEDHLADPDAEQGDHAADEEVGGQREHPARFPHASQVPERDEHDEEHRDRHRVRRQARHDGGQRRGAGRHGHGDGEDVVGQERHAGDLGGQQPEVVPRDDVGATRARVRLDRLTVREDQERQHDEQADRDRHDERKRGDPDVRDEVSEDLLGAVGDRRQVVGREHGERGRFPETLVGQRLGVERRAEQPVLDAVPA
jgi:hypothetical protein